MSLQMTMRMMRILAMVAAAVVGEGCCQIARPLTGVAAG